MAGHQLRVKKGGVSVTMTTGEQNELVRNVISHISSNYISIAIAQKLEQSLRLRLKSGIYDTITDPEVFAQALTSHLRQDSEDKHFLVRYSKKPLSTAAKETEEKEQQEANYHNSLENFGFEEARRLSGNVGYLDVRGFADPRASAETLAAAMTFLFNTNALIIDVRENRGGDEGMVELFCSYFFDRKTKLGDFYYRNTGVTRASWTLSAVPGKRHIGKDVYILTSRSSFSAAEALAYMLQSRQVATIVGEITGGAANPVRYVRLDEHFFLLVPEGKITDEATGTNWEGIGVKPDIRVPSVQALAMAHLLALRKNFNCQTPSDLSGTELRERIAALEEEAQMTNLQA